jgi:hypothetical protein
MTSKLIDEDDHDAAATFWVNEVVLAIDIFDVYIVVIAPVGRPRLYILEPIAIGLEAAIIARLDAKRVFAAKFRAETLIGNAARRSPILITGITFSGLTAAFTAFLIGLRAIAGLPMRFGLLSTFALWRRPILPGILPGTIAFLALHVSFLLLLAVLLRPFLLLTILLRSFLLLAVLLSSTLLPSILLLSIFFLLLTILLLSIALLLLPFSFPLFVWVLLCIRGCNYKQTQERRADRYLHVGLPRVGIRAMHDRNSMLISGFRATAGRYR